MAYDKNSQGGKGGNRKQTGVGDGKPRSVNRRDEVYDGASTRPVKRGGKAEPFFARGERTGGYQGKSDRPAYQGQRGDKPAYPPRGDKPGYQGQRGDKPAYPPRGDRPGYQGQRDDKPAYPPRGDRPGYQGQRDDRPAYQQRGDKPGYQGRNQRGPSPVSQGTYERRPVGAPPRRATPPARPVPRAVFDEPAVSPVLPEAEAQQTENLLVGRNPIREAIKAGRSIDKLLVQTGELSGSARQIVAWAREAHIVVQHVDKVRLDQIYPNHQGMIAYVPSAEYSTVEDILERAKELGEEPFVLVLDGITDPHNLGAIIRTAECAGAHGVIIPERRSAGLNPAAVKASAGACEYQRIAKVVNLSRTIDQLKEAGLWIIGADMAGEPIGTADLSGPIAIVIGSEGEGISNLVQKQCDKCVALPIKGHIESLNASVATGVILYEVLRARAK